MVERYYNEKGELAVLVSHGFGAGWSTWNDSNLAIDKRVVEFFLQNGKDCDDDVIKEFCTSIGYESPYCGGWRDIRIDWMPPGCLFRIAEYDGSEHIEIFDERGWFRS